LSTQRVDKRDRISLSCPWTSCWIRNHPTT